MKVGQKFVVLLTNLLVNFAGIRKTLLLLLVVSYNAEERSKLTKNL